MLLFCTIYTLPYARGTNIISGCAMIDAPAVF
ncbi:unknown [Bacteroides sp. CAG:927]|nr:unknown [Bacteroides sp. CAG:927]